MGRYMEYLQCLYLIFPAISIMLILTTGFEVMLKMKEPIFDFNTIKILLIKIFLAITRFILLFMIGGYLVMLIIYEVGSLEIDQYFFNHVPVFTLGLVFGSWKAISCFLQQLSKSIEERLMKLSGR